MYKIIGADGKEYGPVSLQELKQWVMEGRVNEESSTRLGESEEWKPAADFPEVRSLFATTRTAPGGRAPAVLPIRPVAVSAPEKGLAITSFVLGLTSMVCLGLLTGIPAILCGHVAQSRARRTPERYGGAGFALAGLIMGYLSIVLTLLLAAMLLPALNFTKQKAQTINCVNNLKQVGLALKIWAVDHNGEYSFNVSTNQGGTLELCDRDREGFEKDPSAHFRALSNELATTHILVCPADSSATAARDFGSLSRHNISYRLRTGTNVNDTAPQEILVVCPLHGNILRSDGSVETGRAPYSTKR